MMWNIFRRTLESARAPDISGQAWFNQDALPPAAVARIAAGQSIRFTLDLPRTVTLVDFWDYSSAECVRALPHLVEWWKRYQTMNFMIIGVHTPEFAYATDSEKVRDAIIRFNLSYPVVNDADYTTWERYNNTKWPRRLLVDARGKVRYDFQDSQDYDTIESRIQEGIREVRPQETFTDPSSPI